MSAVQKRGHRALRLEAKASRSGGRAAQSGQRLLEEGGPELVVFPQAVAGRVRARVGLNVAALQKEPKPKLGDDNQAERATPGLERPVAPRHGGV